MSESLPMGIQAVSQVQATPEYIAPRVKLAKVEAKPEIVAFETLEQVEKQHIECALQTFKNNKAQAAKALGVTTKTLYNKLHYYGLFEQYSK